MKLFLLLALLTAQQIRLPIRSTGTAGPGGGGGGGGSVSSCTPTSEQLANRTSMAALPAVTLISTPAPGASWCDERFGRQVTRVSGPYTISGFTYTTDRDQIQSTGQLGFSKDSDRIAYLQNGGWLAMAKLNLNTRTVTDRYPIAPIYDGATLLGSNPLLEGTAAFWDYSSFPNANRSMWATIGWKVYRINTDPQGLQFSAQLVADMSADAPAGRTTILKRCSVTDDSLTQFCSITEDGPSCNSYYLGDPERPVGCNSGYVVFRIHSISGSPTTNYSMVRPVVYHPNAGFWTNTNSNYPTVGAGVFRLGGSAANGYKSTIDRGGAYVSHVCMRVDGGPDHNTQCHENLTDGSYKFLQGGGHSDNGNGRLAGVSTGYGTCPLFIKSWVWSSLTSSPSVDDNSGTCLFQMQQGYLHRQYTSMFGSTNIATQIAVPDYTLGAVNTYRFADEIFDVNLDTGAVDRLAVMFGAVGAQGEFYSFHQPVQNRPSNPSVPVMRAVTSNFRTLRDHIIVVWKD